ncbi:MAG TPA: hypothetical protein VFI35_00225, partial [Actinomycetota bacterium]|nr:hypothetical protein [Actinomycetota bacterium]
MPANDQLTRDDSIEDRAPEIIRRLTDAYPDAKVALRFTNPLECLVATVLSAQSTDETVNRVTETLFQKYRTAEDYLRVPEDDVRGLPRHASERDQVLHRAGHLPAVLLDDPTARLADRDRLLIEEPGRVDVRLQ